MDKITKCRVRDMVFNLKRPANWIAQKKGGIAGQVREPITEKNNFDNSPYEVAFFLEKEFLSPDSARVYFSIRRQTIEDIKSILKSILYVAVVYALFFSLYINMVQVPQCQNKGFADVDSKGCFLTKDGLRVYERSN